MMTIGYEDRVYCWMTRILFYVLMAHPKENYFGPNGESLINGAHRLLMTKVGMTQTIVSSA